MNRLLCRRDVVSEKTDSSGCNSTIVIKVEAIAAVATGPTLFPYNPGMTIGYFGPIGRRIQSASTGTRSMGSAMVSSRSMRGITYEGTSARAGFRELC